VLREDIFLLKVKALGKKRTGGKQTAEAAPGGLGRCRGGWQLAGGLLLLLVLPPGMCCAVRGYEKLPRSCASEELTAASTTQQWLGYGLTEHTRQYGSHSTHPAWS
jgi:hypothetical protein